MSLLYFIAIPLLASFLTLFFKNYLRYISVAINALLLVLAYFIIEYLPITENLSFDSPLAISFVLTKGSAFFMTLFIGISFLFSLYNITQNSRRDIFILTNMLLIGVIGLVLSGDIFNIYIFFEISSITAYILTSLNRNAKAYNGAIKYMIIGSIASIFLLIGIMTIYLNIGTLNLITIGERFGYMGANTQFLVLLSLFIGFGIKTEIFPLNFWAVDIYQATSSKINALFSAILSKAYIFVFFHIAYLWGISSKYLLFTAMIGVISFGIAELSSLTSRDTKRVFAYSTLGQLGVLFIGFSYNNITIMTGAIFLVFMHSITKLMLFLSLDILEQRFGQSSIEIFKQFKSPFLIIIFIIGFLSLLGLPPFGGFIAKLTILSGLAGVGAYIMMGAILVISLVEAVYLFRLLSYTKDTQPKVKISIPLLQKAILASIAFAIIYFGIFPNALLDISQQVASSIIGGVHV